MLRVKIKDRWYRVDVVDLESSPIRVLVDGEPVEVLIDGVRVVAPPGIQTEAGKAEPVAEALSGEGSAAPARVFRSPMPGVIISVAVKVGDQLVTGDEVCVLEAMKMQQTLRADWTGVVSAVHVESGQQVLDGDPIVEL